ncbi:2Fe-2S iron-sulfur cluster-binding protein [Gordonia mangrovi]
MQSAHAESPTEATTSAEGEFTVTAARSQVSTTVAPDRTVLEALREAGVAVPSSCEVGICGTCETAVLRGCPDHRDSLLTDEERRSNQVMLVCVSRSRSAELELDL